MHEMGIVVEIYRVCRETVAHHGGGRIHAVRLEVGELAAVEPDLISFAWEAVTADGPHAGSKLDITWCVATQHCSSCGENKERSEGTWLRICPDCGSLLEVDGGRQLDILDLVLQTDDAADPSGGEPADGTTEEAP
jgi:hydrogenase nickel incorporation protein HypA/HybF